MNFAPDTKTYHLPNSGGLYLSRFHNDTSHILLTMAIENIVNYKSIYLTLLDFMAYASHKISKLYHLNDKTDTIQLARKLFKRKIIKAEGNYNRQFPYINIFITIIDDVFVVSNVDHHDDTVLISLNVPRKNRMDTSIIR